MCLIVVLTLLKIVEEVINSLVPVFTAVFTDTLLCRQSVFNAWTRHASSSLTRPVSQAAFEAMLRANTTLCQVELPVTLGVDCCDVGMGDSRPDSFFIGNVVPLLAPNLRNNLEGFGRIQDLILAQVYFILVSEFLRLFQSILNDYFLFKFQGGLQRKVLDAFLAQDMGFFDARPTGVLLSRIMNDTGNVQGVAAIFAIVIRLVSRIALSASVSYDLNPSLFYLFVCLIPLEFAIIYRQGLFSRYWVLVSNNKIGKFFQVMQEILDKIKHIKVFNGVDSALSQYSSYLQLLFRITAYTRYVTRHLGLGCFCRFMEIFFHLVSSTSVPA